MQNSNNNRFISKDLYVSALCYAKGLQLERIERDGRICWFVFGGGAVGEQLQQNFFSKNVDVNAKEYADALRTLKNLVFSG